MSARYRVLGILVLVIVAFGTPVSAMQDATPPAPPPGCTVVAGGLKSPREVALAGDGPILVVVGESGGASVAAIEPDGTVTTLGEKLPIASPDTAPSGIAVAPDGGVWLLQPGGGVSRLLEDGSPEALGPIHGATGIAFDADGMLIVAIGETGQVLRCDPSGEVAAATEVTISLRDVFFEPSEVTIPANTDVTMHIVNDGFAFHNLAIPAAGVASPQLGAGGTHDLVVNLPAGDYEIACDVRGHKGAGMVGTLHVVD